VFGQLSDVACGGLLVRIGRECPRVLKEHRDAASASGRESGRVLQAQARLAGYGIILGNGLDPDLKANEMPGGAHDNAAHDQNTTVSR
jgi:hypothetical protein